MLGVLTIALLFSGLHTANAVQVYLSPHQSFVHGELAPEAATSTISRHLGLEFFEPLRDMSNAGYEENFVAQGSNNGLLLTLDEEDIDAVLPASMHHSFSLPTPGPVSSLTSVISTFMHRAKHTYDSVFTSWHPKNLDALSNFYENAQDSAFAAVELSKLAHVRRTLGASSEEYKTTATAARQLLERAIENADKWHVAILTFSSEPLHGLSKRAPSPQQSPLPPDHPPPQEPIGSVSTCFDSADTCTNATNSCSGRGQCVEAKKAGRSCFVCTCGVTRTGKGNKVKTETWVGQSCERKDVSGPFVLLTGTVLMIILVTIGSISLLYSVGNEKLPSLLTATAVQARKD